MFRRCFWVMLLWPCVASADMDYSCLSQCKNKGGSSPQCLQQCEYRAPVSAPVVAKGEGNSHKEFVAPVEVGSHIVPTWSRIPQKGDDNATLGDTVSGSSHSKGAYCMRDCLQAKLQYSLCQERCSVPK